MPRVAATLQNQKTGQTLNDTNWFRLRGTWEKAARVINGALSFGSPMTGIDNIGGTWATIITPAPGTDFTITHNLGRPAAGYIIMSKTASGDITISPTVNADPNNTLILQSTAPAGTQMALFIV